jgi:prevent-host-death family protein
METINIHEAKTNLSRLIERVQQGEEIVISKSGKPVAKLIGLGHQPKPRTPGLLKGKFTVSDDFDARLPDDILRAFGGTDE